MTGRTGHDGVMCGVCMRSHSDEVYAALQERVKELTERNKELEGENKTAKLMIDEIARQYEECNDKKGHEYKLSCMVDKSLSFLEMKVEKANTLIKNPHKLLFVKNKRKEVR